MTITETMRARMMTARKNKDKKLRLLFLCCRRTGSCS